MPEPLFNKGLLFIVLSFFIIKEIVAQVVSCEFCEIFKNVFFIEHFLATASTLRRENKRNFCFLYFLVSYI